MIAGCHSGALNTPVPNTSRSVRGNRLAANISGDG